MTSHVPPKPIPAPARPTHMYRPPFSHFYVDCHCGAETPEACIHAPEACWAGQVPKPAPWPPAPMHPKSTYLDEGDHSANDDAIIGRLQDDMISRAGEPNVCFTPRRPMPTFTEMAYGSALLVLGVLFIVGVSLASALGVWP